jgi:hypothetical protein
VSGREGKREQVTEALALDCDSERAAGKQEDDNDQVDSERRTDGDSCSIVCG